MTEPMNKQQGTVSDTPSTDSTTRGPAPVSNTPTTAAPSPAPGTPLPADTQQQAPASASAGTAPDQNPAPVSLDPLNDQINAAELVRRTGLAKSWISLLRKQGKLLFSAPGRAGRIRYSDALQQLEAAKEYTRDPQRERAAEKRAAGTPGRAGKNIPGPGLTELPAPRGSALNADVPDKNIGVATQRAKMIREEAAALMVKMDYHERLGNLVSVDDVNRINSRIAGEMRSRLLGYTNSRMPLIKEVLDRMVEDIKEVEVSGPFPVDIYMAAIFELLEDRINDILVEFNDMKDVDVNTIKQ